MHICVTLFGEEHLGTANFYYDLQTLYWGEHSWVAHFTAAFFTQNSVRWGLCTKLFGLCLESRTLRVPLIVKLRARAPCSGDGRNIVGQQIPTVLDVTCCVRLHTLLHVVGSLWTKFEIDETFSSCANGRKIPKMLGVLASNVESVARGFTSR